MSQGRLLQAIDDLSRWGAYGACALLVAMLGLIFGEVLARKLLGISLEFAWEYASYLLAISFLLGSGHVLRGGLHVRVQLALTAAGPVVGRWLDLAATAFAAAVAGFFAWSLTRLAWASWVDQTRSFLPSNTPLWPFQAGFALGAVLLALQFVARAVRVARGEPAERADADAPLMRSE